ncbi:ABC transporter ATP-binding protein [Furfurilactobacillus curtus]|uniref:ABC transporter ATP-binding protein n=1 Tax=Furfurilactobacillus curtus TaxID=1746200 RepID=A0ABQ5JPG5_9LACO
MMQPIIEVGQLKKHFGNVDVINEVNFTIKAGETIGLIGENGAGKTTLIKMLLGLEQPTSGTISVFGEKAGSRLARQKVGAMLQENTVLQSVNVTELLQLVTSFYAKPLPVSELLERAQLTHKRTAMTDTLSGGQQRRLSFAMALAGNPDVLFLDEPTVGMDVAARAVFWQQIEALRKKGKTIFITSHYLTELEAIAQRLIFLDGGHLVFDGNLSTLRTQYQGTKISLQTHVSVAALTEDKANILSVNQQENQVTLTVRDSDQWLLAHQGELAEFHQIKIQPMSLEAAFNELIGQGDRHANIN